MSCLSRCPYFRGVLNEGFHCTVVSDRKLALLKSSHHGEEGIAALCLCTRSSEIHRKLRLPENKSISDDFWIAIYMCMEKINIVYSTLAKEKMKSTKVQTLGGTQSST